jgi:hypothetical protein
VVILLLKGSIVYVVTGRLLASELHERELVGREVDGGQVWKVGVRTVLARQANRQTMAAVLVDLQGGYKQSMTSIINLYPPKQYARYYGYR